MDKAWARVVESSGCQFWIMLFQFLLLKFRYLLSLTTIPTEMTRLYICFLFICQVSPLSRPPLSLYLSSSLLSVALSRSSL
jgi:hypothetical protein